MASFPGSSRAIRALTLVVCSALASCASLPPPLETANCSGTDLRDVPVVRLPPPPLVAQPVRVAIMLSGDGGWRLIDEHVTRRLRQRGVPVAGFDTPAYYRHTQSADASACALARLMRAQMARWNSQHVILIGYSRGADVLPFMVSRLPDDLKASIDVVALLGAERTIEFRYHPTWIPFNHPKEPQFPVLEEIEKLRGKRVLCVYGKRERDTVCRGIDPTLATAVPRTGGHHFAGNYNGIADLILGNAE